MAEGGGNVITSGGMPPVFISYSSQDEAAATAVLGALERHGIRCWIAPRDVSPGEFYAEGIVHAIDAAKAMVLVLSQHAAASLHVLREVERASSKGRPIVSFRTDLAALPGGLEYFLNTSHWLDASSSGVERALPRLVGAVQRLISSPPPGAVPESAAGPAASYPPSLPARPRLTHKIIALSAVVALGLLCLVAARLWLAQRAATAPTATAAAAEAPATSGKSVAVLPFVDTSEKKDQEYFSDGLSEELIDLLGRVPGLRVPARTSSFYFKGKQATLAEIAQALGVSHVLEGSVRTYGQQLRVTAELVRVADDTRIWSDTYDRKLDDVFKVQDDIAGAVVKALKISLLAGQQVNARSAANGDAYTMYLKGKSTMKGGTEDDFVRAQSFFERAVAIDPAFAPGWAALGDMRSDLYSSFRVPRQYQQVAPSAHAEAARALELDPNLPDAHLALGRIAFLIDLDWETASRELSRTLELAPANAMAWRFKSYLAGTLGDNEHQRSFAEQAIAYDPLDYWNYFAAGLAGYMGGRLADGERLYRRAIELNERAGAIHAQLARLLIVSGKPQEALEELEHESAPAWRALAEPLALDALGRHKESDAKLAQAEALYGDAYASQIASVYAMRNDSASALKWMERSFRQHDSAPLFLRHDPMFRSLEGNPNYQAILKKMQLPL